MESETVELPARESSSAKRARLRGTFTPTKDHGYNRKQRQAIAAKAVQEGRAEIVDAGCSLADARKELVNPDRKSLKATLREIWQARAALRKVDKREAPPSE